MKWCRFQVGKKVRYGIVEGESVVEVQGTPFGRHARTNVRHRLSAVRLLVPCIPPTFYASGGPNYRDHIAWANSYFGTSFSVPKAPHAGYRASNALIAHGEPIVIPRESTGEVHYEGELVVVIGRMARRVSKEEALGCVLGYTIGNDVSERAWQMQDPTLWRSKNADTFKPMGPWIETDLNLDKATTIVRINGKVVQQFKTNNFIFDVATYISEVSRFLTLHPGDVFWMGTDGATLPAMRPGDVVEIEISGIGALRNPVVKET